MLTWGCGGELVEWSRSPLCRPCLCGSGAKNLEVKLELLLISRTSSWEEELEVQQRRLRIYLSPLGTFVTISRCVQQWRPLQNGGCRFPHALQVSLVFLCWLTFSWKHTDMEILGDTAPRVTKQAEHAQRLFKEAEKRQSLDVQSRAS